MSHEPQPHAEKHEIEMVGISKQALDQIIHMVSDYEHRINKLEQLLATLGGNSQMSRYTNLFCEACHYHGWHYCNTKRCPACGGELRRVNPLRPPVATASKAGAGLEGLEPLRELAQEWRRKAREHRQSGCDTPVSNTYVYALPGYVEADMLEQCAADLERDIEELEAKANP